MTTTVTETTPNPVVPATTAPATPPAAAPGTQPAGASETPGTTPPVVVAPIVTPPVTGEPQGEEGAEIRLTKDALNSRMSRHTEAKLMAEFGTKDPAEVKTRLAKLAELEAKEESERLARLSETERLTEEVRQRDAKIAQLEAAHEQAELRQQVAVVERRTTEIARGIFKEHAIPGAIDALRANTRTWSEEERRDEVKGYARATEFLKDYANKIPELKRDHTPEVVRTTPVAGGGAEPPNKPHNPTGSPAPSGGGPKNVKDMNHAEYAAWKRANGLSY